MKKSEKINSWLEKHSWKVLLIIALIFAINAFYKNTEKVWILYKVEITYYNGDKEVKSFRCKDSKSVKLGLYMGDLSCYNGPRFSSVRSFNILEVKELKQKHYKYE